MRANEIVYTPSHNPRRAASPRDLMVQEVGHAKLRERGIDLIAADNPGSFIDATPTAKLVRQVLGAISEFDKAMTVAPLS
jgi:hypothetical protein